MIRFMYVWCAALVVHCEQASLLVKLTATLIEIVIHFGHVFMMKGYSMILPTMLRVGCTFLSCRVVDSFRRVDLWTRFYQLTGKLIIFVVSIFSIAYFINFLFRYTADTIPTPPSDNALNLSSKGCYKYTRNLLFFSFLPVQHSSYQ